MHLDRPTYGYTGKLITILYYFGVFFSFWLILFLKTLPLLYPHVHVRLFFYFLQAGARFLELPGNIVPPFKLATKRMKGVEFFNPHP